MYYRAAAFIGVFILLGWLLYHLYAGGFISAWFTSCVVALIALMALSIPRRIVVTEEKVEVRCLLDITRCAERRLPRCDGSTTGA